MHFKHCFLLPLCCAALSVGTLAQETDAERVRQAHGGAALERLAEYQARGVVDTPDGASEFTLKVSGDRSRLEVGGRAFVRQGAIGSWRSGTGRWSDASRVWEGLRDVYLLPVFAVREIGFYGGRPGAEGLAFHRTVPRRTHIGYQAPRPTADLTFDPETRLLSGAVFGDESGGQSPVRLRYAEYRTVEGIPLPGLVTRQVGDAPAWTFRFDSFDFRPEFTAGDFDLEP